MYPRILGNLAQYGLGKFIQIGMGIVWERCGNSFPFPHHAHAICATQALFWGKLCEVSLDASYHEAFVDRVNKGRG
jgi:hypothetical protein